MKLSEYRKQLISEYEAEELFLGTPEEWFPDDIKNLVNIKYACKNGHVSTRYLKSEHYGGNVCLKCYEWVYMMPLDMTEEKLGLILNTNDN